MNQKYSQETKDYILKCYLSGKSVLSIQKNSGIPRSTMYRWIKEYNHNHQSYEMNQKRKENILKQQFTVSRPNEVWVSDVTYYTYNQIRYYICVVVDLFARKVVAWKISKKNSTQLTKKTFMQAYSSREITGDLLFHSDQGSNFVSKTFMNYLKELNVKQSFSKPGRPYDNSVCESFFSNFKQEELYRHEYKTAEDLKRSINKYMVFYNNERPHSVIRYQTPNKAEAKYYDKLRLLKQDNLDISGSNV